ncbi:TetR family transcriptional regulator [Streptomyces phyllanthi]|uniref:TetR family transcriptional regulator n=1 Tax=Streptomyces phyllanthi TaxID=1803180 RepID=A0A5N8VWK3_9ACTN|nr:TetR family transcriptional regulator [Streptomyces phyllanthi]
MSDEQRELQRLDISRHAVRLFAERGVAATSGEQIAQTAGVSERTLWRCFRTKESCVEPLLTKAIEAFRAALHTWPADTELTEHLREAYEVVPDWSSDTDAEAVLAVIRMTLDEPALRAAYLMLRERAEDTFAEVLAERTGVEPDAFVLRAQAAAVSAVFKVATDRLAVDAAASGISTEVLDRHREQLANALSLVTRGLSDASRPRADG